MTLTDAMGSGPKVVAGAVVLLLLLVWGVGTSGPMSAGSGRPLTNHQAKHAGLLLSSLARRGAGGVGLDGLPVSLPSEERKKPIPSSSSINGVKEIALKMQDGEGSATPSSTSSAQSQRRSMLAQVFGGSERIQTTLVEEEVDFCTYHEDFMNADSLTSTYRGDTYREIGSTLINHRRGMDGDRGGTPLEKVFPPTTRRSKHYQVSLEDPKGSFKFRRENGPFGPKEGEDYEGRTCSHKRVVRCQANKGPKKPAAHKEKKKGKALFIYMMHSWDSDDRPGEWSNMAHFMQFGILPPNASTNLYDGADYIFIRSNPKVSASIEACQLQSNILLLWLPPVPCDLCGHRRVLDYIGYKREFGEGQGAPNYEEWPYKTVVFMNSGVRGPLLAPTSEGHWLDILGMAGQARRSVWYKDHSSFKTVGVSAFSWESEFHAQSYFLSAPLTAVNYYFDRFHHACKEGKHACIFQVEVKSVNPLHAQGKGFSFHSFLQNFTFGPGQSTKELRLHYGHNGNNPTYQYTDACKALFLKFGGGAWGWEPVPSKRGVLHLCAVMRADQQVGAGEGGINGGQYTLEQERKKVIRSLFDASRLTTPVGNSKHDLGDVSKQVGSCRFFRDPHGFNAGRGWKGQE